MTNFKTLLIVIFGILLALFGEWLGYFVYTSKIQGGFLMGLLGFTAFVTVFGGVILIWYPLIKSEEKINQWLINKNKLVKFSTYISLTTYFLTPPIFAIVCFYHFTNIYTNNQLAEFGIKQRVKITRQITGKNSRHDLLFKFNHEGKNWDGMLDSWKYNIGDSAEIIFSSDNPNEVEWYLKFIQE